MQTSDVRQIKICQAKGIAITPESVLLDFGCSDGHRVYQMRDLGYTQAYGYNKVDYMGIPNPVTLRHEADAMWFRFSETGIMPWPDNTFDLVLSDQVFEHVREQDLALREIHRVLKPGGVAIHVLPAKWKLIEPHIFVPLGGFQPFKRYAYYYAWAMLGVRSNWQGGLSARETAQQNLSYATDCLNYLSCRQYARLLSAIPVAFSWEELAYMQTSYKPQIQRLAAVAARFPLLCSVIRTFKERVLFLRKEGH